MASYPLCHDAYGELEEEEVKRLFKSALLGSYFFFMRKPEER